MAKPQSKAKIDRPLLILDIETDPFLYGRVPRPFVVGLYFFANGEPQYRAFWGESCIADSIVFLNSLPGSWLIYAHNGGKFDFLYYLSFLSGDVRIINGRIVSARMCGHEIRDSYAVLPFPLRNYKKDEIDYAKMETDVREQHRDEILSYLRGDCEYLYDLVSTFHADFGQKFLTIGSTAMAGIRQHHPFAKTKIAFDRVFRPHFFYGGRVECFQTGIIEGEVNIYDINSSYPDKMRNWLHPIGDQFVVGKRLRDDTCFVVSQGESKGAFPVRTKNGIDFPHTSGIFAVSRHEFDAAIDTGTYRPHEIIRTFDFADRGSFASFVDHAFNSRAKAKELGDSARDLLYKFYGNSGYGKFAQNPSNFFDWKIATLKDRPREVCKHCRGTGNCFQSYCFKCMALNEYAPVSDQTCMFCGGRGDRWMLAEFDSNNPGGPQMWRARTFANQFYNVATGSSITGAARAALLRGLSQADKPLYCDTDSIITLGEFHGDIGKNLGQWKHEGRGVLSAIAGKKMYAIFSDQKPVLSDVDRRKYPWMLEPVTYKRKKYWCVKKAHKGLRLEPVDLLHMCMGFSIEYASPAPSFGVFRDPIWIKRVAKMTA